MGKAVTVSAVARPARVSTRIIMDVLLHSVGWDHTLLDNGPPGLLSFRTSTPVWPWRGFQAVYGGCGLRITQGLPSRWGGLFASDYARIGTVALTSVRPTVESISSRPPTWCRRSRM